LRYGREDGKTRIGFATTPWSAVFLLCTFLLILIPAGYAGSAVSADLIAATEREGKAVALALHEYHLKQIEIEIKGIDLND
jgi:hypothetical protein